MTKSYYKPGKSALDRLNGNRPRSFSINQMNISLDENGMENLDEYWAEAEKMCVSKNNLNNLDTCEYFKLLNGHEDVYIEESNIKKPSYSFLEESFENAQVKTVEEIKSEEEGEDIKSETVEIEEIADEESTENIEKESSEQKIDKDLEDEKTSENILAEGKFVEVPPELEESVKKEIKFEHSQSVEEDFKFVKVVETQELEADRVNFDLDVNNFEDDFSAHEEEKETSETNKNKQIETFSEESMVKYKVHKNKEEKERKKYKRKVKPVEDYEEILDNPHETPKKMRKKSLKINVKEKEDKLLRSYVDESKVKALNIKRFKINLHKRPLFYKALPINQYVVSENNEDYEESYLKLNKWAYTAAFKAEVLTEIMAETGKICVTIENKGEFGKATLKSNEKVTIEEGIDYQIMNVAEYASRVKFVFHHK